MKATSILTLLFLGALHSVPAAAQWSIFAQPGFHENDVHDLDLEIQDCLFTDPDITFDQVMIRGRSGRAFIETVQILYSDSTVRQLDSLRGVYVEGRTLRSEEYSDEGKCPKTLRVRGANGNAGTFFSKFEVWIRKN